MMMSKDPPAGPDKDGITRPANDDDCPVLPLVSLILARTLSLTETSPKPNASVGRDYTHVQIRSLSI